MRRLRYLAALVFVAGVGLVGAAAPVSAAPAIATHPLGNFTTNHYDGLHFYRDRVESESVVDTAEIPTLQAKSAVDINGDGTVSPDEAAAYAAKRCAALARAAELDVGDRRVPWTVLTSAFAYQPGAVHLQTGRLTCALRASADLSRPTSVRFSDDFDSGGVGWHETTAVTSAVALVNSPLPAGSISDELRHYPNDLLASPLNVRGASVEVRPSGNSTYSGAFHVSGTNAFSRALNRVNSTFNGLVGRDHLTVGVGTLAILLAVLLGAGHALLPGHGKTIMAAYLVGRRGRLRDVLAVGGTVTLTHTAGVLLIGLLISVSSTFEPTTAERWLGVCSGLLVVVVGLTLLRSVVVRRRNEGRLAVVAGAEPAAAERVVVLASAGPSVGVAFYEHAHEHGHAHEHDHSHPHAHGTEHMPYADRANHSHSHGLFGGGHSHTDKPLSRSGIVGLGIAGGLVPSPSALVVLLGTIALGRTAFGIVLVFAYGLGLAVTLTVAGILLVPFRNRLERARDNARVTRIARYLDALPVITALLVVCVGALLALRSLTLL